LFGRLGPWLTSPSTSGVFLDFDGTLAPIVDVPEEARPWPGTAATLGRVARRYGRVAVISGRPVAYLVEQLGAAAAPTQLVGLYGLERATGSAPAVAEPGALAWQATVDRVAAAADAAAPPGLRVERKGLAVTLHFRQAPGLAGWAANFASEQAAASGLVAQQGKQAWELRPPGPTDKGTVVSELAAGLRAVCFAGDDTGDLPAFAALARLRATGVDTLGVAVAGPETPDAVAAAADVVVEGPSGVLDLLEALAGPSGALPR
jgi:trehalose 6-phosphate phosphatase